MNRLLRLYRAAWIFYCGPLPHQRRPQQRSPRFVSIISNLVNLHVHSDLIITIKKKYNKANKKEKSLNIQK